MPEQPCAFHPDRLTGVSCSRCERPICTDDMVEAPVGIHCPVCAGVMREGALGQAGYRARTKIEQTKTGRRITALTLTRVILVTNVAIALLSFLPRLTGIDVLGSGALLNPLPSEQWWRVFTSMFIHVGLLHLLFNMYALTIFGPALEDRYGRIRFAALYLLAGAAGGAATLALSDIGASAGASGSIFGLFGGWFAFFLRHRRLSGARAQLQSLAILLVINLALGLVASGINNFAHGGGLVAGFVLTAAMEEAHRRKGLRLLEPVAYVLVTALIVWAIRSNTF